MGAGMHNPSRQTNCLRFVIIGPDKVYEGQQSFTAHARIRNKIVNLH